ncbi:hypothetical protein NE237_002170 [Protea cynaroides]|uniref:Pre-nudix hydrolase domain-containing protein n=1 Tax=Protea cynaroides TaxID=273540 RepID=A0A9Q0KVL0_9MAGN|nr:hypothetical protein NE237_002170 [Protea cynaroides]
MERVVSENVAQPVELLHGVEDNFGGVIVDMKDPLDSDVFVATLRALISQWRQEGKKGVWIKFPIELVNLVEAAVKKGFCYHHAEPKYLMLVYWIPESCNTIPANFVIMLTMIQLLMKPGDFLGRSLQMGCQSQQSFFGESDLLFIGMLRPLSLDIQKQEAEIEAAQWMPIEDYVAQPFVQKHQLAKSFADLCIAKINERYAGFTPLHSPLAYSGKLFDLYLNSYDLNKPPASL